MSNQFIIVKNKTNPLRQIKIQELRLIIPATTKLYKLPYDIAFKYKDVLSPIEILTTEPPKKTYTTEIRNIITDIKTVTTPVKKSTKKTVKKKKPVKKIIAKKQLKTPETAPSVIIEEPTKE